MRYPIVRGLRDGGEVGKSKRQHRTFPGYARPRVEPASQSSFSAVAVTRAPGSDDRARVEQPAVQDGDLGPRPLRVRPF